MTHIPDDIINRIVMMSRPKPNPVIQNLNDLIKSYESFKRISCNGDGFIQMALLYRDVDFGGDDW